MSKPVFTTQSSPVFTNIQELNTAVKTTGHEDFTVQNAIKSTNTDSKKQDIEIHSKPKLDTAQNQLVPKNIRLPRDVLPIRYDIRLFPVLEKGNFSVLGQISVDVQCEMETDRIVLHSVDISVDPNSVKVNINIILYVNESIYL